jgi:hypothetical protein
MEKGLAAHCQIANSVWVLRNNAATHFLTDAKLVRKRLEITERNIVQPGLEADNMEYMAQFEMHDELRTEIIYLAEEGKRSMEIAKRMPGLMQGQLKLLHSGIASQVKGLFDNEDRELGETDADSMIIALYSLNRCLLALIDIGRSKKVIPTLA